jgi:riboflavin kinase / FMN adenylyltransferase
MEILRSLEQIANRSRRSTVTIGSFDGIHVAHQELLRRIRERGEQEGAASVAVTFDPHPLAVLAPEKAPRLLTPMPIKLELLEQSQIDRLLILPFTLEFSHWSPERFVEEVLVKALGAESVLVGDNFRFGFRQAGTPQTLEELGRRWNFRTEILPKMTLRGWTVSSSQIRNLLEAGKIALANRLLRHSFSIRGPIARGLGIGRTQTVPTLNLGAYPGLLPAEGVYITLARVGRYNETGSGEPGFGGKVSLSQLLRSVTNVGCRPTFGGRELGIETHLLETWLETWEDASPVILDLRFLHRLRPERKFDSPEQLKAQILRDAQRARRYFDRLQAAGIAMTAAPK